MKAFNRLMLSQRLGLGAAVAALLVAAPAARATEITNPADHPAPIDLTIDGQSYHDGEDTLPGYDDYACTPIPNVQYDFAENQIQYYDAGGDLVKAVRWTEWSRISSYDTWVEQQKAGSGSTTTTPTTTGTTPAAASPTTTGTTTQSAAATAPAASGPAATTPTTTTKTSTTKTTSAAKTTKGSGSTTEASQPEASGDEGSSSRGATSKAEGTSDATPKAASSQRGDGAKSAAAGASAVDAPAADAPAADPSTTAPAATATAASSAAPSAAGAPKYQLASAPGAAGGVGDTRPVGVAILAAVFATAGLAFLFGSARRRRAFGRRHVL